MLKTMISFIAATIFAYVGQMFLGMSGMILGSVGGALFGWWAAKRLMPR